MPDGLKDDVVSTSASPPAQSDLPGRVTALERDLSHLMKAVEATSQAVSRTNQNMQDGFTKVHDLIEASEERATRRENHLLDAMQRQEAASHDRAMKREQRQDDALKEVADNLAARGQTNWSLVAAMFFGGITAVGMVAGGLLTIFLLLISPLSEKTTEIADNRADVRVVEEQQARQDERIKALERMILKP